MGSGYLDSVMGLQEGGSTGVGLIAALKSAGIATGAYAPWILGGSMATSMLGKFLGSAADRPAERMNMRLGNQQLELNSIQIEQLKREQAEKRAAQRKHKAMSGALSGIFGKYKELQLAGGGA